MAANVIDGRVFGIAAVILNSWNSPGAMALSKPRARQVMDRIAGPAY
jgi:hypothetical protein